MWWEEGGADKGEGTAAVRLTRQGYTVNIFRGMIEGDQPLAGCAHLGKIISLFTF